VQRTRFKVCDHKGNVVAIHVRVDEPDGTKKIWWEAPDGSTGLPAGVGVTDLPLFGSELVRTIPLGKSLVVTEGEKAALALRAGGVPALATVTGAATAPTPKALRAVALGARFILWPDNDKAGVAHMKMLGQNLFLAGALGVTIIDIAMAGGQWPKGYDAADVVTPETARILLGWMVEDWPIKARRPSARKQISAEVEAEGGIAITLTAQRDKGSVTAALHEAFGMDTAPGRNVKCPMHDDRAASLSVLKDDLRVICHAPCVWATPGVTASEIKASQP
jgi:hypothetical protein